MCEDYGVLMRALSGFTDQLEAEANQATEAGRQAEVMLRNLFPEEDPSRFTVRLRQFDVRAEELARTTARLRSLLSSIASARSARGPE